MKTFKYNDWPFNAMRFIRSTVIEAHFNVGNPRKNDIIIRDDKQYKITDIEYNHDIYLLFVREQYK